MVDARPRVERCKKKKKERKKKVIAFIIRALPTKYKFYRGFSVSRPVKELNGEGGKRKERKKGRKKIEKREEEGKKNKNKGRARFRAWCGAERRKIGGGKGVEAGKRRTEGRERLSSNDELNDVFVFSREDSHPPPLLPEMKGIPSPFLVSLPLPSFTTIPLSLSRPQSSFSLCPSFPPLSVPFILLHFADLCYSLQGILSFSLGKKKSFRDPDRNH